MAIAFGRLKSRQLGEKDQLYDATIKGKAETTPRIWILRRGETGKFIYAEGTATIEAIQ